MNEITNFYEHFPASGIKPRQVVVLLHGYGSNGQDLISLAPLWAQNLPDAVFVSPDAPFSCEINPVGFQWFSLQSRDPKDMYEGASRAAPILKSFVEERLQAYNVNASSTALVGFSQGTMMSLFAGPRYEDEIAGVLGYSGALIGEQALKEGSHHTFPVCLIHGQADDVVPIQAYEHAAEALTQHGFDVSGHTTPFLGHGIDEQGIKVGGDFLQKIMQ